MKNKLKEIKKGVRVDLDNIIENLEGYKEAHDKMSYEDMLFTQINSYFQAVLTKMEALLTSEVESNLKVIEDKVLLAIDKNSHLHPSVMKSEVINIIEEQLKALSDIGGRGK